MSAPSLSAEVSSIPTPSVKRRYNTFIKQAKEAQQQKQHKEALLLYSSAYSLLPVDDQLRQKIEKMKIKYAEDAGHSSPAHVRLSHVDAEYDMDECSGDYVVKISDFHRDQHRISHLYRLPAPLYQQLYFYQRQGIHWLCNLHAAKMGGILGDDMGLGKTVQIAAFLSLLHHSHLLHSVLLFAPLSVIPHWQSELHKWCPALPVYTYDGSEKRREQQRLQCAQGGGILLITYGMLKSGKVRPSFIECNQLTDEEDEDEQEQQESTATSSASPACVWDYLILDEGHCIKNPDIQLTKSMKLIPAQHRLLVSGTPLQNDLNELWCLFDFVCCGCLLGDRRRFRHEWCIPIQDGYDRNATQTVKMRSNQLNQQLQTMIQPYLLRREKKHILHMQQQQQQQQQQLSLHSNTSTQSSFAFLNVQKNDLIVWLYLTPLQVELYESFLTSSAFKAALKSERSPLAQLTILKKLCDHPKLLPQNTIDRANHADYGDTDTEIDHSDSEEDSTRNHPIVAASVPPSVLLEDSMKMRMLITLLHSHRNEGHRTLVFSQSVKMLDLIVPVLHHEGFKFLRIDGKVSSHTRQQHIQSFIQDLSYHCFLLTTGVGGVGLNLTAADRCIVFDPSWNPAVDNQSVDRCYRLGQQSHVIVYRFITCGTVEEVIYRKQVFKQGLFNSTIQQQQKGASSSKQDVGLKTGYFTKAELREVFRMPDHKHSQTQAQLAVLHPPQHRKTYPALDKHLEFLQQQGRHSSTQTALTTQRLPLSPCCFCLNALSVCVGVCMCVDIFGLSDHDLLFNDHAEELSLSKAFEDMKIGQDVSTLSTSPTPVCGIAEPHATTEAAAVDSTSYSNNQEHELEHAKRQALLAKERLLRSRPTADSPQSSPVAHFFSAPLSAHDEALAEASSRERVEENHSTPSKQLIERPGNTCDLSSPVVSFSPRRVDADEDDIAPNDNGNRGDPSIISSLESSARDAPDDVDELKVADAGEPIDSQFQSVEQPRRHFEHADHELKLTEQANDQPLVRFAQTNNNLVLEVDNAISVESDYASVSAPSQSQLLNELVIASTEDKELLVCLALADDKAEDSEEGQQESADVHDNSDNFVGRANNSMLHHERQLFPPLPSLTEHVSEYAHPADDSEDQPGQCRFHPSSLCNELQMDESQPGLMVSQTPCGTPIQSCHNQSKTAHKFIFSPYTALSEQSPSEQHDYSSPVVHPPRTPYGDSCTVCESHREMEGQKWKKICPGTSWKCLRCSCFLTAESISHYESTMRQASSRVLDEGSSSIVLPAENLLSASIGECCMILQDYLYALQICDQDAALHAAIGLLNQRLKQECEEYRHAQSVLYSSNTVAASE